MLSGITTIIFDIGGTLKISYEWGWYADARPALERLSQHHQLLVGANQPAVILGYLESTGMAQYFRHIYLSEELGVLKPDPQFFLHILGQEGLSPSQVAMVGDDLENDIAPAKALGMRTFWIRRGLGLDIALERGLEATIKPDYTLETLDELR